MRNRNGRGCGCYQERHNRFLEPSILYLLWQKRKHGYEIIAELPEFGFFNGPVDPGAIYRTLRHLEEVSLVLSEWDTSGTGPAKRVYAVTELGKEHLGLWANALRQRCEALNSLLNKIDLILDDSTSN